MAANLYPWLLQDLKPSCDGLLGAIKKNKHTLRRQRGSNIWSARPCTTVHMDAIKLHARTSMHLEAICLETLEDNQTVPGQFENCNRKEFHAPQDAFMVFHFVIKNMFYTTDFADLVQLCVDLGATNLSYL